MNLVVLGEIINDTRSGFASGAKDDEGIAQIRMNNVTTDGDLDLTSIRRVPVNSVKNLETYMLNEGDVLFNSTNSPNLVGKSVRFVEQDEPFVFSNHFLRIIPDPEQLESRYLARWLTYQQQQGVFELLCTKWVNQAAVRRDDLLALKIPLPPLSEQRRIAAVLDAADGLRAKRRAALGKLDALLQSVFLEMFGDPVRNERGWETKTLESIVQKQKYALRRGPFGGALKKEIFVPTGYKVYEQQHAIDKDFSAGTYFINETKYREMESFSVYPGDFIISCSGTVGQIARLPNNAVPGVINQALLKITINEGRVNPTYFEHLFGHPSIQRALFETTRGSGIKNFPPMEIIRAFSLPIPPMALQQKYKFRAEKVLSYLKTLQKDVTKLEELFSSLQQRAFRGQL